MFQMTILMKKNKSINETVDTNDSNEDVGDINEENFLFEHVKSLAKHQGCVNVVRFSPCGKYLASSGDDSFIFIWDLNDFLENDDSECDVIISFRSSYEIYDLCWSSDGSYLVTAEMDNSVTIWDIEKKQKIQQLIEHVHHVQGVALDPLGEYLVSWSVDRNCNVYKMVNKDKFVCEKKIRKRRFKLNNEEKIRKHQMYLNESVMTFFRRGCWSPDGQFYFSPCAIYKKDQKSKSQYATYIFSRNNINDPIAVIPSLSPSVCVRCNPKTYQFNEHEPEEKLLDLPYFFIFSIATNESVTIYNSSNKQPLAFLSDIHYEPLTDLAWNKEGTILAISSKDGFCSFVQFDNQFGKILHNS